MGNNYFRFKQFVIKQESAAMKVGTDGVLLGAWADVENANSVLDIGTGSGLIALMIAQRCKARISSIEIDMPSALQANYNFEQSQWGDRLSVDTISLQEYSKKHTANFDLIVSNPPYFNRSLKSPSPRRTLTRHTDELDHTELLEGVSNLLNPDGRFCAVFPYTEGNLFIGEANNHGLYCNKKMFVQTKPNKSILRILLEFSFYEKLYQENTISIHNNEGEYTADYKKLTADFYLAF